MVGYCDYHVHTKFSADSKAELAEVCNFAVRSGLKELCFTEHVDLIPWDPTCGYLRPADYMAELERCRARFAGQLSIRAGLEISEPHLVVEQVEPMLSAWPFDFVLGSAHWIDQSGIYLSELYDDSRTPQFVESEYLKRTLEVAKAGDFDSLGHLDLIKRYRPQRLGPFDPLAYADLIRAILRAVVQRDKAIEINTSPLRKGLDSPCPDLTVLCWYKELGGEKLTLGSDSHSAEDVGTGIDVAIGLARVAGFGRIVTFERRQPSWMPL